MSAPGGPIQLLSRQAHLSVNFSHRAGQPVFLAGFLRILNFFSDRSRESCWLSDGRLSRNGLVFRIQCMFFLVLCIHDFYHIFPSTSCTACFPEFGTTAGLPFEDFFHFVFGFGSFFDFDFETFLGSFYFILRLVHLIISCWLSSSFILVLLASLSLNDAG